MTFLRKLRIKRRIRRIKQFAKKYFVIDLEVITIDPRNYTSCSGCGASFRELGEFNNPIWGKRINHMSGGLIPEIDFTWCLNCAQIAFEAVRKNNASSTS